MDEDDVPPPPAVEKDSGFSGALGRTVGSFVWIAIFIAIAGVVLYALTRA
jgi:hypothetical protein